MCSISSLSREYLVNAQRPNGERIGCLILPGLVIVPNDNTMEIEKIARYCQKELFFMALQPLMTRNDAKVRRHDSFEENHQMQNGEASGEFGDKKRRLEKLQHRTDDDGHLYVKACGSSGNSTLILRQ